MKKFRKTITISSLAVYLLLSGCMSIERLPESHTASVSNYTNNNIDESINNSTDNKDSSATTTKAITTSVDTTPTMPPEQMVEIMETHDINGVFTFFRDERAWVVYPNDNYGLIDTEGNLIYTAKGAQGVGFSWGGYGYYYTKDGFVIIDADGNRCYTYKKANETDEVKILSYNEDVLVLYEHISDFANSTNQIRMIDRFGISKSNTCDVSEIMDEYDWSGALENISYIGEGIFFGSIGADWGSGLLNKYVICNANNNSVFTFFPEPIGWLEGYKHDLHNGDFCYVKYNGAEYYLDDYKTEGFVNGIALLGKNRLQITVNDFADYDSFSAWYESDEKTSIDYKLPDFGENIAVLGAKHNSQNGLYLLLRGADDNSYFALCDMNGNVTLEPVKLPSNLPPYDTPIFFIDGDGGFAYDYTYLAESNKYFSKIFIVDSNGKTKEIKFDDRISFNGFDGEYIYTDRSIISVETGEVVIDKVKVTSETKS